MKRFKSVFLLLSVCTFLPGMPVFARDLSYLKLNDSTPAISSTAVSVYRINIKAVRDFMKSFAQAENVSWYTLADGSIVYFTEQGTKAFSRYDSKGNLLYNVQTYTETHLPKNIQKKIKKAFAGYSIGIINEIRTDEQTSWLLHLEDARTWKTILFCNEEIDERDTFNK